jgi:hypothetical protein
MEEGFHLSLFKSFYGTRQTNVQSGLKTLWEITEVEKV